MLLTDTHLERTWFHTLDQPGLHRVQGFSGSGATTTTLVQQGWGHIATAPPTLQLRHQPPSWDSNQGATLLPVRARVGGHGGVHPEVAGRGDHLPVVAHWSRLLLCGEERQVSVAVRRLQRSEQHHGEEPVPPPAGFVCLPAALGGNGLYKDRPSKRLPHDPQPGDEWKTPFNTPMGHYKYPMMPFNLTVFQGSCA